MTKNRSIEKIGVIFAVFFLLWGFPLFAFSETAVVLKADEQFAFAESYFNQGEYFRAIGEFQRFIHFFPQDERVPTARFKQGESYFKGHKH